MKVLMVSTDEKLFDRESSVGKRHIEYGKLYETLFVIVFSNKQNVDTKLSENVFVYSTKSKSKISRIKDATHIAEKIVKENQLGKGDLITVQDPFFTALVGVSIKYEFDLDLEIQVHTDIGSPYFKNENFSNYIRFLMAKNIINKADRVRVVSNKIKDFLVNNRSFKLRDSSKIEIRPIDIDVEKIRNTQVRVNLKEKYPQFSKVVIMASRLTKEKDIKTALRAFKKVVVNKNNTGLVVVGSGPESSSLKQKAESLGLKDNVVFEDWVDQQTLFSYYKTADIFLSTSLYEGYGMSMAEANAANLPIVATDAGIASELTKNICPVGDAKCLAEKLIKILS